MSLRLLLVGALVVVGVLVAAPSAHSHYVTE